MSFANPYQQYQQNQVNTASPGELTLMLYNGAIKFINLAVSSLEKKDLEKAHGYIIRTQDIITELRATLNMDYDISHSLSQLYEFIYHRLIQANIKKDKDVLLEVKGLVEELRDTWQEAVKIARKQGTLLNRP